LSKRLGSFVTSLNLLAVPVVVALTIGHFYASAVGPRGEVRV
jgi:hypothetical protein